MIVTRSIWREFREGHGARAVLRDVSFSIAQGEIVAIVGSSGSGKSTLMNILGLLDRPSRGDVEIDGVSVARLNSDSLADLRCEKIGFVFQSFHLLPRMSVLDNVALPLIYRGETLSARRRTASSLLEQLGLATHMEKLPGQLSGGQRQRVAVARSLVGRPRLVLADEPTGNLDSVTAHEVMSLLCDLNTRLGLTVIVVTHDPSIADRCNRRLSLRDGCLLENDPSHLRAVSEL